VGLPGTTVDEGACRVREVLDRVGDKWSLAVVNQLGHGPLRFTEVKRATPGISQRVYQLDARASGRHRVGAASI
jgi:DNA-binding HxlR family transcriptional regulator